MTEPNITEERWFHDPFGWYKEEGRPQIYGVQLTDNVALDFMEGLTDMYEGFERRQYDKAMHDARVLATLLIASAMGVGQDTIEELLSEEFATIDVDAAFKDLVEDIAEENK
jgi:hypothetical protein